MNRDKKICFCFTARRIVGTILLVTSLVNLLVVRAVVDADFTDGATATSSATVPSRETDPGPYLTLTAIIPTATGVETLTYTSTPTDSASPTTSFTFTQSPTATSTVTSTSFPTPTLCLVRSYWPNLYVQRGDTLYSLARNTGSTVNELMQANCLADSRIYAGQLLYVPRLPIPALTPTTTSLPTVFMDPYAEISTCDYPPRIYFSVLPHDPEGITDVTVSYTADGRSWIGLIMQPQGDTYFGSTSLPEEYASAGIIYYYFSARDGLANYAYSPEYKTASSPCQLG